MNSRWIVPSLATAAVIAIGALQSARSQDPPVFTTSQGDAALSDARLFTSRIVKASQVIGADVKNAAGEKLAEIKDLVLDPSNGDIAYAVVQSGGALFGGAKKLFAMPWAALTLSEDGKTFLLDADQDMLAEAPGFDPDNWPNMADRQWAIELHRYYGRAPYWEFSRRDWYSNAPLPIVGTVTEIIDDAPFHDVGSGTHCVLQTERGPIECYLAPRDYLQSHQIVLQQNAPITVTGYESVHGGRRIVVGTQMRQGDQVLMLRQADGRPMWTTSPSRAIQPPARRN